MEFFNSFLAFDIQILPYIIISLMIAFTVHEFAHAYVAYKFGDPTAKRQGRLTLNPSVHLDPLGTIFLLLFGFGWARPVPVNRFNFKNPRLAGILTSVAGPLSNLLMAFIGGFILLVIAGLGDGPILNFIFSLCFWFIYLNVLLFVFNLIPIPPLDGYRIVSDLLPNDTRAKLSQYEIYGVLIFLVLVLVKPLYNVTIGPILGLVPRLTEWIILFYGGLF
jgi:Zn-dependent protease